MSRALTLTTVAVGLLTVALATNAAKAAAGFDHLVVLGDSLSDIGNAGRFSNGPVWVEHLARRFGVSLRPSRQGGTNFAVGGARIDPRSGSDNLVAQADAHLKRSPPTGRTLHVVYGGGNDLLAAVGHPQASAVVDRAVQSLKRVLSDLAGRGATDILVPNLPDVGMTPAVRAHGTAAVAEAGRLTDRFNAGLEHVLAELSASTRVRVHRLDVKALSAQVAANPAGFGFVDVTTPCNGARACEGHLFWDDVHPTSRAHRRLAEAALQALAVD